MAKEGEPISNVTGQAGAYAKFLQGKGYEVRSIEHAT